MNNELANNTDLNSLEQSLRDELSQTEAGTQPAESTEQPDKKDTAKDDKAGAEGTPKPGDKDDSTDAKPKADQPEGNEDKAAKTEGDAKPKGDEKPEEKDGKNGKDESDYQKARKDKERFRVNWAELEKGKTELKAQEAELQRQREQFDRQRATLEAERVKQATQVRKTSKWTPEQLEQHAKGFEAEGKHDLAQLARARAAEQRQADRTEQEHSQRETLARRQQATAEHWQRAQRDFPDVATEGTPLRKKSEELLVQIGTELKKHGASPAPVMHYLVVQHAHALLQAETAQAEVESSKKRVTELETEIKRLTKSNPIPGARPPGAPPAKTSLDKMPLADQGKTLRAELEMLDKSTA